MFARFPFQRGRAFRFPAGQSFRNAVKCGREQQQPREQNPAGQQTQLGGRLISEVFAITRDLALENSDTANAKALGLQVAATNKPPDVALAHSKKFGNLRNAISSIWRLNTP
jgi:purine nucleoside permease